MHVVMLLANFNCRPKEWIYNAGKLPSKLLRDCPSCYDVIVDPRMSNWYEAPGWGNLHNKTIDWKEKAVAHYMNKGFMKTIKEPKELVDMSIPFTDMVRYVLGDTLKELL